MIAWILGLWLASAGTGSADHHSVMVVSNPISRPDALITGHGASRDSSQLTFSFPGGRGRFVIPICNAEVVSGMPSSELVFENAQGRHRIYQNAPDNLEWELQLLTPPASPFIDFPIETAGLDYHYQPPLSAAEFAEGAERADSVVGSYAVYHAADAFGRTAKAFHIYRPRAWDAADDTVWCSLAVDPVNQTLTVGIPPRFLASAVYPVTVDPTFGFSAAGASTMPMANTVCYAGVLDTYTASSGDRIVQFHAWLRAVGDGSIDMAVYRMIDGAPDTRLAGAVTLAVPTSGAVMLHSSGVVSQSMVEGDVYCVAMGGETGDIRYAYDTVEDAMSVHTASGNLPTVWIEGARSARRLSIYVTYEESQGDDTETAPRRRKQTAAVR